LLLLAGCGATAGREEVSLAQSFVSNEITNQERTRATDYFCARYLENLNGERRFYPLMTSISATIPIVVPQVEEVHCSAMPDEADRVACTFSTVEYINERVFVDSKEYWNLVFTFEEGRICGIEYLN
jgi:hypothetical protein